MAVPYQFANTPNGSTIPLAQLDANFAYVENQISSTAIVDSFAGGSTGLLPASATTGAITLGGTLNIANGGTGATTATGAMTNLLPTQTGQSGKFLTTDGSGNLSWAAAGSSGVIGVSAGGTGLSSVPTSGQLLIGNGTGYTLGTLTGGTGITIANTPGGITINATGGGGSGTVTSVGLSGGATGFTVTGTPVLTSGTMTLGGFLNIASGGTGATTATAAITNLLPTQSVSTNGQVLTSNGTSAYWAAGGSAGGVTSFSGGGTGLSPSGTATGAVTLGGTLGPGNGGTGLNTVGTSGQVLTSNGTSIVWGSGGSGSGTVSAGAAGQLAVYAASGSTVSGLTTGTAGQILTSNGTSATWANGPTLTGPNTWTGTQNFSGATVTLPSSYPTLSSNNSFTGINTFSNATNGLTISGSLLLLAFGPGAASVYSDGNFIQMGVASNNLTQTTAAANSGTTSTGPYNNVSDARIKENVVELTGALSLVNQLKGVYFNYISNPNLGRQVGLIAQDVLSVVPEVVTQTTIKIPGADENEPPQYAIAYASLVPVLINAIKELEARVAALESKG